MSFISHLFLQDFRSYAQLRLDDLQNGFVVLHGDNGAGKTNILEALSLLAPGRGMRGAMMSDVARSTGGGAWAVSARLQCALAGEVRLGTGVDPVTKKRMVRIDGQNAGAQAELGRYISCVWVTPQMDRLFLDQASVRRKFLDRFIVAFDPAHTGRVMRYDNAMSQRSKLLRSAAQGGVSYEESWVRALESQMAEAASAIVSARLLFLQKLQGACDSFDYGGAFPRAQLALRGVLEGLMGDGSARSAEEYFKEKLFDSRARDGIIGGAEVGPHKTDLLVSYAEKNMAAAQCSTGEQKALLLGLVLAHAQLIKRERGAPPLLLLDEIAAHLDEGRRAAFYDLLQSLGGQVWLTGTEASLFDAIAGEAQMLHVESSRISAPDHASMQCA